MIRRSFALFAAASLATFAGAPSVTAQESRPSAEYPDDEYERYSDEQLDNLVGSIALYPDALLAQVLVAATFPDQVEEAARFVRANGTDDVDDQNWDVSVKAVAHYPSALNMMADKGDWTIALGRAYAVQSSDVMAAVQRMRAMADAQGNLLSNQQQSVSRDDGNYIIAPTQTRVIYVPVYDPYVIYTRPIFRGGYYSPFWSFGIGFPIGVWLNYDFNWRARNVYYHGWDVGYYGYGGGWRQRSRPFINITNIYVNPRYRNVYINRDVIRRRVEYRNVDRYGGVHRDTRFSRGPVVYRGTQRSVGYDRGYDRRDYDRSGSRNGGGRTVIVDQSRNRNVIVNQGQGGSVGRQDNRTVYSSGNNRGVYDRNSNRGAYDRGSSRSTDRSVIVERGQGGSVGRTPDRTDRGGYDRSSGSANRGQGGGYRDVNPSGTWGRDNAGNGGGGRRSESSVGGSPQRESRGGGMSQPDRAPRDESRGRGNGGGGFGGGSPSGMSRGSQRNDGPMINPRGAEPQGGGGGRGNGGGGNGGGRGGRERP
ncbi:MAG: DUF3300 domain-containing protein [Gemmatimonadota bacterium]